MGARSPLLLLAFLAALLLPHAARATSPAQQLADRYAPVVVLKNEPTPCSKSGERWRPVPVEIVLGNPEILLRGPGKKHPIVDVAPTAADLYRKGAKYFLNFPGDPLQPGCTYARDGRRFARGKPSIAYAHIAREPGVGDRLALQYFFFYYFNAYNDLHEADWEGIQLVFDVGSVGEALRTHPVEVGYAQHDGGERARWDSRKLQKDGDHVIVYSASGSHASYYSRALWLGRSRSQGVGCDDTRGPGRRVLLGARLLPTHVDSRASPNAWLAFTGRWGQKEPGANNGPTGPNTKPRWTHPITWQESLRTRSFKTARSPYGPSVSGAYCGTVAAGSDVLNRSFGSRWKTFGAALGLLALVGVLAIFLVRRTTWRPTGGPIRARRDCGQILGKALRIYAGRFWLFVAIGLISFVFAVVGKALERLTEEALSTVTHVDLKFDFATFLADLVAIGAGTAVIVDHLDRGSSIHWWRAVRLSLGKLWTLLGANLLELVVFVALMLSIVGIPWGIRNSVAWSLTPQEVMLGGHSTRTAPWASIRLVRGNWWRSAVLVALLFLLALVAGPVVGLDLLLFTSISPFDVDLIGSLVYALVLPYVGIATTLLYFDLLERFEEAPEPASARQRARGWWRRLRARPAA
ncbi:MAG TPA: hypothetical protein VGF10_06550 [Gaiella sp.]